MKSAVSTAAAVAALSLLAGCSNAATSASGSALTTTVATPAAPGMTAAAGQFTVKEFDSTSPQAWTATFQVLSSPTGNILIDPGKYDDEVAKYVTSIGGVDAILITHGHWDKLRGLDAALAANPKATAYIHQLDQPYLHDSKRNCSIEDGFNGTTDAKTTTFTEGTQQIAGHKVQFIHLPGHTEGSSVFYFPDDNLLIGGDTIMSGLVGSSRHPGGNEADRQASIKKFKAMTFPADMRVYNGHDKPTTYAELMKSNVDLR